jgi:hypothetical protein
MIRKDIGALRVFVVEDSDVPYPVPNEPNGANTAAIIERHIPRATLAGERVGRVEASAEYEQLNLSARELEDLAVAVDWIGERREIRDAGSNASTSTGFRFECPSCGSDEYGSRQWGGIVTRRCHGEEGRCSFSAPADDDWQHFVRVSTTRYRTREEYERAVREET